MLRVIWVASVACLFLGACTLSQRGTFPLQKLDPSEQLAPNSRATELTIRTSDSVDLNALFFDNQSKYLVLYFHGNGGSLQGWRWVNQDIQRLGANLLIIDYRGYGKSGGTPSEIGVYLDAKAAYQEAKRLGYPDSLIILYGRSLGSGVAVDLAQDLSVKALVLETPYSSIRDIVYDKFWFMLPWLYFPYDFNSCEKVSRLRAPTILIHGTADQTIPFGYGQKLSECFGPRIHTFVTIPGGHHGDLSRFPQYWTSLESFLQIVHANTSDPVPSIQ